MLRRKPAAMYRSLLTDALLRVWQRKTLWVFGLLAAGISSAGIGETLLRVLRQTDTVGQTLTHALAGSFVGLQTFSDWVQSTLLLPQPRVTATLLGFTILLVAAVIIGIHAQGILVQALLEKKSLSLRALFAKSAGKFWHILSLAVLTKIALSLAMILSTLALLGTFSGVPNRDDAVAFAVYALLVPLVIVISAASSLALIDIVKHGSHALDALHRALTFVYRHPLAILELGLLLFLISFFILLGVGFILSVLGMGYVLAQIALASAGWILVTRLVFILALVFVAVVVLTSVAAIVTFQYACWILFYERAAHPDALTLVKAKLIRVFSV